MMSLERLKDEAWHAREVLNARPGRVVAKATKRSVAAVEREMRRIREGRKAEEPKR